MPLQLAYLVVCGATTAARAPELVRGLLALVPSVVTLPTERASRVIAPRELSVIEGNRVVESFFDEAILPRPPLGLVLVAPCTFNSLNKIAHGVADNLALSVVAEAIGRRTPVIAALALNLPLTEHPLTASSIATLRGWGVSVIEPTDKGLADSDVILAEVKKLLAQT